MKISQAIHSYQQYHSINSKKTTLKNYQFIFTQFQIEFGYREVDTFTPDEILSFLTKLTDGNQTNHQMKPLFQPQSLFQLHQKFH